MLGEAYSEYRQGPEMMAVLLWEYLAPLTENRCMESETMVTLSAPCCLSPVGTRDDEVAIPRHFDDTLLTLY